jgi:hypothetical protein
LPHHPHTQELSIRMQKSAEKIISVVLHPESASLRKVE